MIYDYHCVACGHKLKGEEISFDLTEILGIRNDSNKEIIPKELGLVSAEQLKEICRKGGQPLIHKERVRFDITFKDFMGIISGNFPDQFDNTGLVNCQFEDTEMIYAFQKVWPNDWNAAAVSDQIETLVSGIISVFSPRESAKGTEYVASCILEAEFFDEGEGEKIYTIQYLDTTSKNPHMLKMSHPNVIRGYCPHCGGYVLEGTGKYPHVLIGLLGAQRAGKTSVIISLIYEMLSNYNKYGVKFPGNILCDNKWDIAQANIKMYEYGWSPEKTNVSTNAKSFNASFLLEIKEGTKRNIITFVDIAGEQCYDKEIMAFSPEALQVYPLISGCDIYLLCTCMSEKGYKFDGDTEEFELPARAVMEVAKGIYENIDNSKEMPPMCIVATKSDMFSKKKNGEEEDDDNPFEQLKYGDKKNFFNRDQIDMMKTYYETGDSSVREQLKWCCWVYDQMKDITYISMLYCSAMGRSGKPCPYFKGGRIVDIEKPKDEQGKVLQDFRRENINVLWKWILQVLGMRKIEGSQAMLQYIPVFTDSYSSEKWIESDFRTVFTIDQFEERLEAVRTLFLNESPHDTDLEAASLEELTFFERAVRRMTVRDKMIQTVKEWG